MNDLQADIVAIQNIEAVPTILEVVCRTTGMRFAAVARVTEDRWIACSVRDEIEFGLTPGGELKIETTICNEIRQTRQAVIIDHVAQDDVYRDHHTPRTYGLQSYISMPIVLKSGKFFGTLCAIDSRPAVLKTPETIGMFKLFAELIAFHLDAAEKLTASEFRLTEERQTSELREQFIAVLGHDLRNPLGAIGTGASILQRISMTERATSVVELIRGSVVRMAELIDNLMDFARGRLGGGITLDRNANESLKPVLMQVIDELKSGRPDKAIEFHISLAESVHCDRRRLGQLFSNLLSNALTYGTPGTPVRVQASSAGGQFELSVANASAPIAPAVLERLFLPFVRGEFKSHEQGLGLGLYIASEIAAAHQGILSVSSTETETRFTLRMPSHPHVQASEKFMETAA